jgi:hypothetical protein
MKILLIISFFFLCIGAYAQTGLNDIGDTRISERIQAAKIKTDSFLLDTFKKKEQGKFRFEFLKSAYYPGDSGFAYRFLNHYKPDPSKTYSLTHHYIFFDKEINLYTDINVYYYEDDQAQAAFQTPSDSLKYSALIKIYNKGMLKKIKEKAAAVKFKQPYVAIDVDEQINAYNIILRDKTKPHNYFIK